MMDAPGGSRLAARAGSGRHDPWPAWSEAEAAPECFRQLVEAAPVAILVCHLRRCVFANDAAMTLLAADDSKALLGSDVHDLLGEATWTGLVQRLVELQPQRGRPAVPAARDRAQAA